MSRLFLVIAILCAYLAVCDAFNRLGKAPTAFTGLSSRTVGFQKVSKQALFAAGETPEQIKDRIRQKVRKNLYSEKGVAYAPWVTNQIDEDAIVEDLYRKELQGPKKKVSTLDRGEIEGSEGMRWRMNGDQVELAWVTNNESGNQGFILEKRSSYASDFQEIASFREVTQLVSRGDAGGRYKYLDPSSSAGSWVYRVKDCDTSGSQNVICQCFVEVQSASDSKVQSIVLVGFIAVLVAAFGIGISLDPQQ